MGEEENETKKIDKLPREISLPNFSLPLTRGWGGWGVFLQIWIGVLREGY